MEELLKITREYSDAHRAMGQLFLKHRALMASTIGPVFKELCHSFGGQEIELPHDDKENEKFLRVLKKSLNDRISQCGLRIVDRFDELHRDQKYWVMISELQYTESLATVELKPDDLALFRLWLGLMFGVTPRADAENADGEQQQQPPHENGFDSHEDAMGEVTVNRALNAAAQKVNMKRAQDLLNKLKGYEWISVEKNREGLPTIRLTVRAIAELEPMLSSGEFRIRLCDLCQKSIIYRSMSIECPECENAFHASCLARYVDTGNGSVPCPARIDNRACKHRFQEQDVARFAFDGSVHA